MSRTANDTMKSIISSVLAINTARTLGAAIAPGLNQTVILNSSQVLGNIRDVNGILSFLGIPYAQPQVGKLRWQPPQAPLSSHSILTRHYLW
jgi:para-nitrobenzyl esterase